MLSSTGFVIFPLTVRLIGIRGLIFLKGICRRRRGRQRMRWMDGTTDSETNLSELRDLVMDREAWRAVIHAVTKSQT